MEAKTQSLREKFEANWIVYCPDTLYPISATIPGCIHRDLENAGVIPNPLVQTNELKVQWVGEKNWIYETVPFDVSPEIFNKEIIRLVFEQIDTYADVFLNNTKIYKAENTFLGFECDVKGILKEKENVLQFIFTSPVVRGKQLLDSIGYKIPGDPLRAISRKPQYHFGWDWGPKLITMGITGEIQWNAYDTLLIKDTYVKTQFLTESRAEMSIQSTAHISQPSTYEIEYIINDSISYKQEALQLDRGIQTIDFSFSQKNPKLWWSNGLGEAYLYTLTVIIRDQGKEIDRINTRFGIREVSLITEKDNDGETFYFQLNGKPVFAKGANYIPIHMLPGANADQDYEKLLELCKQTHFNMLRVWGGGYYEKKKFYDLCDEKGILIWQDFMFACSMYPVHTAFLNNVKREAQYQTMRLRNHPCIALWCGNNENAEGWERWGWQMGLKDEEKKRLKKGYDDVFADILPAMVHANTSSDYWESSPRFGRGDVRSTTEGDSHYWGLWHDAEPFEILNEKIPRFMSEFGMQSFPSFEVMKEMLADPSLTMDDTGLKSHQKHPRGNQLMEEYMLRWLPPITEAAALKKTPEGTLEYLRKYGELTQSVQAEGMLMGIEAHRRNAPYCMGTLFWQLNDVWPAFSWSAVDYKFQPKIFMSRLKESYAPQLLSPVVENNFLNIYYINDWPEKSIMVDLELIIKDFEGKEIYRKKEGYVNLEKTGIIFSNRISDILGNISPENLMLEIIATDLGGNVFLTRTSKLIGKSNMGIRMTADGWEYSK